MLHWPGDKDATDAGLQQVPRTCPFVAAVPCTAFCAASLSIFFYITVMAIILVEEANKTAGGGAAEAGGDVAGAGEDLRARTGQGDWSAIIFLTPPLHLY